MNKLILDVSLGDKLKTYRKIKNFTQSDVVRKAGLLGSTMSESTFSYDDLFGDYEKSILDLNK